MTSTTTTSKTTTTLGHSGRQWKKNEIEKRRKSSLATYARSEGRAIHELVSETPLLLPDNDDTDTDEERLSWLVVLNASADSGVDGAHLLAAFSGFSGLRRVEMHLGGRPHSFAAFASVGEAAVVAAAAGDGGLCVCSGKFDGKLDDDDGDFSHLDVLSESCRPLVVAFAARLPEGLPPRPLREPAAAAAAVRGLVLLPDFVTAGAEERELLKAVGALENSGGSWESLARRKVQHYGYRFDYPLNDVDRRSIEQLPSQIALDTYKDLDNVNEDLPQWAHRLLARVPPDLVPIPPNQLTVNLYAPGGGIAPHCDRHSAFYDGVLIFSLASDIVMEFRKPAPTGSQSQSPSPSQSSLVIESNVHVVLPARSLAILTNEARYAWQHAIRLRKLDVIDGLVVYRQPRCSLTFRRVRPPHDPCRCGLPHLCD